MLFFLKSLLAFTFSLHISFIVLKPSYFLNLGKDVPYSNPGSRSDVTSALIKFQIFFFFLPFASQPAVKIWVYYSCECLPLKRVAKRQEVVKLKPSELIDALCRVQWMALSKESPRWREELLLIHPGRRDESKGAINVWERQRVWGRWLLYGWGPYNGPLGLGEVAQVCFVPIWCKTKGSSN